MSVSLDDNPNRFNIDAYVLAVTITNCAFRRPHRWNAILDRWAFGKWMVLSDLFYVGNGYFSRSCSVKSHSLSSDRYLSAEIEKGINVDCCRLNSNARRSCNFVENGLTSRSPSRCPYLIS